MIIQNFRSSFGKKGAKIVLKLYNYNYNQPWYDIFIFNMLILAILGSFWWRYGYIFNIFNKLFHISWIFPQPWVAQVMPLSMSGATFSLSKWNVSSVLRGYQHTLFRSKYTPWPYLTKKRHLILIWLNCIYVSFD